MDAYAHFFAAEHFTVGDLRDMDLMSFRTIFPVGTVPAHDAIELLRSMENEQNMKVMLAESGLLSPMASENRDSHENDGLDAEVAAAEALEAATRLELEEALGENSVIHQRRC